MLFSYCLSVTFLFRSNRVVLVDASGHVTYVERTMHDGSTDPDEAEWRLNSHEFDVIQETGDFAVDASAMDNLANGTVRNKGSKRHACPIH